MGISKCGLDVLVLERFENADLGKQPVALLLVLFPGAEEFRDADLVPRYFGALLGVKRFVDDLEGATAQDLVRLQRERHVWGMR